MIGLGPIKNEIYFSTQGIQMDLAPQQLQLVATPVPLICVYKTNSYERVLLFLCIFHHLCFTKHDFSSTMHILCCLVRFRGDRTLITGIMKKADTRTYFTSFFCTEIFQLATMMGDKGSLSPLNTTKVLYVSPLLIVDIISNQPPKVN